MDLQNSEQITNQQKKSPIRAIIIIIFIVVIGLGGYFGWKYYNQKQPESLSNSNNSLNSNDTSVIKVADGSFGVTHQTQNLLPNTIQLKEKVKDPSETYYIYEDSDKFKYLKIFQYTGREYETLTKRVEEYPSPVYDIKLEKSFEYMSYNGKVFASLSKQDNSQIGPLELFYDHPKGTVYIETNEIKDADKLIEILKSLQFYS